MEQETLTPAQRVVINEMANESRMADFYLTGGTALSAYYLFHRISDDLDFFILKEPDIMFIHEFVGRIKKAVNAKNVRYERLYDRNLFYFALEDNGELKIEFTKYPFSQLEPPKIIDKLRIDSLRDIEANKLMAMLERFDPKDFVDLFYLLQSANLESIRRGAETKFGVKIGGIFLGGELAKVGRIKALPKMLKPLNIDDLKEFFSRQIKGLSSEILE